MGILYDVKIVSEIDRWNLLSLYCYNKDFHWIQIGFTDKYLHKPITDRVLLTSLIADSSTKMADIGDDKKAASELNGKGKMSFI